MEVSTDVATDEDCEAQHPHAHEIDWDAYASQYDLLATNNPSYRENIEILRALLSSFELPINASICDVGAGTGNFVCALARDIPHAKFVHLDTDLVMNRIAKQKYAAAGVKNVELHSCSATEASYPSQSFDLVICVNALYAIHPQEEVLRRVRSWLRPNGVFFAIDFGRRTKMLDWARYILGNIIRKKGIVECIRFLLNSRESIRQNRRGSQGQAEGTYWLHTTKEFGRICQKAGFVVQKLATCYRGYCDMVVCRLDHGSPRVTTASKDNSLSATVDL